jgi:hypothetical protein
MSKRQRVAFSGWPAHIGNKAFFENQRYKWRIVLCTVAYTHPLLYDLHSWEKTSNKSMNLKSFMDLVLEG